MMLAGVPLSVSLAQSYFSPAIIGTTKRLGSPKIETWKANLSMAFSGFSRVSKRAGAVKSAGLTPGRGRQFREHGTAELADAVRTQADRRIFMWDPCGWTTV